MLGHATSKKFDMSSANVSIRLGKPRTQQTAVSVEFERTRRRPQETTSSSFRLGLIKKLDQDDQVI